ncbi:MAG TPA: hypothetical protein VJM34_14135 [Novosphingobium sp.]|nr:hypothetical protein [Novosphingobium sp.]
MRKHIVVARAADGDYPAPGPVIADVAQFVKERSWIEHCVVHVATPEPMECPVGAEPDADGSNFAVELWTADDRGLNAADVPFRQAVAYEVQEIVEKGSGSFPPGAMPGVTLFSRNMPKAGVPLTEIRARYDRHPLVALRVHVGMETYVRNPIESGSPEGAPGFASISVLYFPTDEALVNRLYSDEQGMRDIGEDVSHFLGEGSMLFKARSHALK